MGSFLGFSAVQWQNATRVALGVLMLSTIDLVVKYYTQRVEVWNIQYPDELANGLQWGAITVIVVASPLVGSVARTGLERTIGTISGGLLGMAAVYTKSVVVMAVISFAAALAGYFAGAKYGREYSGKLFAVTFLIVGPVGLVSPSPIPVCLSRILGILSGILLMFILSMLYFPRSASDKAIEHLKECLDALVKLSEATWSGMGVERRTEEAAQELADALQAVAAAERREASNEWRTAGGASVLSPALPASTPPSDGLLTGRSPAPARPDPASPGGGAAHTTAAADSSPKADEACEEALFGLHKATYAMTEALKQAGGELFLGTLWGHRVYAPLLLLGRSRKDFHMPVKEMEDLRAAIRRAARIIWTLHLTLGEGFDAFMLSTLQNRYPTSLLFKLQQTSVAFARSCAAAMPHGSERAQPRTTTIFWRCFRSLRGASRCCRGPAQRDASRAPSQPMGPAATPDTGPAAAVVAAAAAAAAAAGKGASPSLGKPSPAAGLARAASAGVGPAGRCRQAERNLRLFRRTLDVLTEISEGQRNQIMEHIRRYSQAVPRAPPRGDGGDTGDDAASDRFSFDEPAVDEAVSTLPTEAGAAAAAGGAGRGAPGATPLRRAPSRTLSGALSAVATGTARALTKALSRAASTPATPTAAAASARQQRSALGGGSGSAGSGGAGGAAGGLQGLTAFGTRATPGLGGVPMESVIELLSHAEEGEAHGPGGDAGAPAAPPSAASPVKQQQGSRWQQMRSSGSFRRQGSRALSRSSSEKERQQQQQQAAQPQPPPSLSPQQPSPQPQPQPQPAAAAAPQFYGAVGPSTAAGRAKAPAPATGAGATAAAAAGGSAVPPLGATNRADQEAPQESMVASLPPHLPRLRISPQDGGTAGSESRPESPRPSERLTQEDALPQILPHIDTPRLFWPAGTEGYLAKVRWYSFQFQLEMLETEFDHLLTALEAFLAAAAERLV